MTTPNRDIIKLVATYLGWSVEETEQEARKSPYRYKHFSIPKRSGGGFREIRVPSRKTKALQYAILDFLLNHVEVHPAAMAYRKGISGSPLLRNARHHQDNQYLLRLDFRNFFGSIRPKDLRRALGDTRSADTKRLKFLEHGLFASYGRGKLRLAIGAPSSPTICNIVCHEIDTHLDSIAKAEGGSYTRYADDIFYSHNQKGACKSFAKNLDSFLSTYDGLSLTINRRKTRYMSRKNRRLITGLVISTDGAVTLGRKRKRYIRSLVHKRVQRTISAPEDLTLQGLLAFVADIEPEFATSLVLKYGPI